MPANDQPVINKIIKRQHAGHHGGSWKVAYADFVTAMMAFFLLMWLLNSTTAEQKQELSNFFEDPIIFMEKKQAGGDSIIDFKGQGNTNNEIINLASSQKSNFTKKTEVETDELELNSLIKLKLIIEREIVENDFLNDFKEQLVIELTDEGLQIQVIDIEQRSMFALSSSQLKGYAVDILSELSTLLTKVPNRISVSGHTDAVPYNRNSSKYSNWELSSDRAHSARRTLISAGMPEHKVGRVVGLASSVLYDKSNPFNPVNRRISIVVLNKQASKEIGLDNNEQTEPETLLDFPSNRLELFDFF